MSEILSFPGLGLEIPLSRVALSIPLGGMTLELRWYGVIIALAFAAGLFYAMRRMKEFGIYADRAIDVIIGGVIGGIIGARLYYVLFSWDYYSQHLGEILQIWNGGIAIYGGIIGAFAVGILMCIWRKVKILPMLDLAVGGFLIGQCIGRWGNFINIEAFGSNTSMPWGMTSDSIVRYLSLQAEELAKIGVTIDPSQPVHPTFFYESAWCLLGFLLVAWYTKRRRFDGELTLLYAAWYGLGRSVIEGLRTDSLMLGTIRISQLVAILCVVVSAIIWLIVRGKIRSAHDPEYLKLYALTEEAQLVLSGEYYQKLKEEKKAPASETKPSSDWKEDSIKEESAGTETETAEEEKADGSQD